MKFAKSFESFQEGLNALKKVSFSATSALTNQELKPREIYAELDDEIEAMAVATLAKNVVWGSRNGNPVSLRFNEKRVGSISYTTTGGLSFGWYGDCGKPAQGGNFFEGFTFWVERPIEHLMKKPSSLEASALENGWVKLSTSHQPDTRFTSLNLLLKLANAVVLNACLA